MLDATLVKSCDCAQDNGEKLRSRLPSRKLPTVHISPVQETDNEDQVGAAKEKKKCPAMQELNQLTYSTR